ncbi:MAG: hypothetical protein P3T54_08155 [Dehalogenimonas sp.]|uniref:Uncharacterized protein n=1 Tax=Candidatus Dehalogenimonas loeffleri TaxID=3127115 RepID=A0ABZ2J4C6_9CHLR|nr:hypothetical protein [Dehalogenimonas sp.]
MRSLKTRGGLRFVFGITACLLVIGLTATACTSESPEIDIFPVNKYPEAASFLALNTGKLVVENDVLRLKSGGDSHLLIWPYGWSYRISGIQVEVLNQDGEFIVRSGQYKAFGGGEVISMEPYTGISPSGNAGGPYWLVGSVDDASFWHDQRWYPGLAAALLAAVGAAIWVFRRRRKA